MELYRLTWINHLDGYYKNKLYGISKLELKEKLPELIYNQYTKQYEKPRLWKIDKLITSNKSNTLFCDIATDREYCPELNELFKPESYRCNEEERKIINKLLKD